MGWADEHELEEKRILTGHSNAIGARDIEQERMSEHQIRDQLSGARRWQQMRSSCSGWLISGRRGTRRYPGRTQRSTSLDRWTQRRKILRRCGVEQHKLLHRWTYAGR